MDVYIQDLNNLRKTLTFQNELPETVVCSDCKSNCRNFMIVDDREGELSDIPPKRVEGIPIWPHDSAVFSLYMCEKCGKVETVWNQG